MIDKIFRTRSLLTITAIIAVVSLSGFGYRALNPLSHNASYCALMPDAIGLYPGSAVTVFGVGVGKVTSVRPDGTHARVDFEINDRRLAPDVGATTLSQSLIADRRLALIGVEPAPGEPVWPSGECITKTVTPKSITQTLTAMSELADELNGTGLPGAGDDVAGGLQALADATEDTGEQINAIITGLGRALESPDAAIGRIGDLISALSTISAATDNGWDEIKSMLVRLPPTLVAVDEHLIAPSVEIIARLRDVLPPLNDITTLFGGELLAAIEAQQNLPQMLSAGVGSLVEAIDMIPVYTEAFDALTDPATGAVALSYRPPPEHLPAEARAAACSLLPGHHGACQGQVPFASLLPALTEAGGSR